MAEISKITLPSGSSYDIKDATARSEIATIKNNVSGGMHYIGVTTTALTDGSNVATVTIDGKSVSPISGDIVIYDEKEFIATVSGSTVTWHEFGSTGSLKALAFKDQASGKFTPSGTVSQPTFNGNSMTSTGKFTPEGSVSISKGTGAANYTPEGSLSGGAITVTPNTANKFVAGSASGGGSVTPGSAASCTLPALTTSVADETLTIGWSAGSFTANTPTAVTMPTFSSATVASGVKSATISTLPTFTGTGVELTAGFTGSQGDVSVSGTPTGTVTKPTFTGSEGTVTVS